MNQAVLRRIETNDETLGVVMVNSTRELRQVITAVPDNSNFCGLVITSGDVMDPDIATALSAILPRMPFLRRFSMRNCDCSNADGLSILASALANRDSLFRLYLENCLLGKQGAEIIASSLSDNTTLKKLSLFKNFIDNAGAIAIASLLSSTSSIEYVNLRRNNIGADGMSALAASICGNRSVIAIDLEGNTDEPNSHFNRAIYDDASIESVVSSNHTLQTISPQTSELKSLLELNAYGPEKAVQAKIIRFLNDQPTFVLSMGLEGNLLPSYMGKIGSDCKLNTMFELTRNVPGLFDSHRKSPDRPCRKRSRSDVCSH